MNRFGMLTQLREDINRGNDHGLNYNKFVLTGIIVHDSNDRELINQIKRNFVKWAEMIGEKFLFITFVSPSNGRRKNKNCQCGFSESFFIRPTHNQGSFLEDLNINGEHEVRTIPLLRDFLNLPQKGSYLLLSNDICSNGFHRIDIDARNIQNILFHISDYFNIEELGKLHSPASFKALLDEFRADDFLADEPLLDLLIDYVSISSAPADNNAVEIQRIHANKVIEKLRNKLKTYEGSDFENRVFHLFEATEIISSKFIKSYSYTCYCIGLDYPDFELESKNVQSDIFSIKQLKNGEKLDNYSQKLYKTYYKISKMVDGNEEDLDYSGLTIYLGKIVENELHLSIGQMLRWSMGIEMPEYFNKYCARKHNVLVPAGNQVVNLNKSSSNEDNRQIGLPMGTLMIAYDTMINHPELVNPQPDSNRLRRVNKKLILFMKEYSSKYRNLAGHIDPDSNNIFKGAKEKFDLFLSKYLEPLYNIRIDLSGEKQYLNSGQIRF